VSIAFPSTAPEAWDRTARDQLQLVIKDFRAERHLFSPDEILYIADSGKKIWMRYGCSLTIGYGRSLITSWSWSRAGSVPGFWCVLRECDRPPLTCNSFCGSLSSWVGRP